MARSYTGGKTTPHYYNIDAAAPIDNRSVVQTLGDLYDADTWRSQVDEEDENLYLYEGLIVYVQEKKTAYALKDIDNWNNAEGWKVVGAEIVNIYDYITDEGLNEEGIDKTAALSVLSGIELLKDKVGLDENGKIPVTVLPDSVTSGLVYGGTATIQANGTPTIATMSEQFVNISNGEVTVNTPLDNSLASLYPNVFFIINTIVAVDTNYSLGDWLISSGRTWEHIKQASTVSRVCGLTGDISTSDLSAKLSNSDLDDSVELVTRNKAKSIAEGVVTEALTWIDIRLPNA